MVALTFVEPDPNAVHFGNGDSTFSRPDIHPVGRGVTALSTTDFNGVIDIVGGNRCLASVTLLRDVGGRRFESPEDGDSSRWRIFASSRSKTSRSPT